MTTGNMTPAELQKIINIYAARIRTDPKAEKMIEKHVAEYINLTGNLPR